VAKNKDACEVERAVTSWLNTQVMNFYQQEIEKLISQHGKHINCDTGLH
jgi:predicted RNA-binding protein YlqC (UPF0109 family)